MRKFMIYAALAFVVVLLVFIIALVISSNPLRKPVEEIREMMLELTPIGMNMEDAVKVLDMVKIDNNWERMSVNYNRGVVMGELGRGGPPVGKHSIRALLGRYRDSLGGQIVDVHWAFNENYELMEIFVNKLATMNLW